MEENSFKRFEMKKVIACVLCLLLGQSIYCQEITVSACFSNPNDSSAIYNPRFDLNDELCALIVIHLRNLDGVQVKGAIVDSITKGSELLVYVPTRTKRATVFHNDYIPLTLDINDLWGLSNGVVGGKTYDIYLSGVSERMAAPKKRSNESNYVCFESNVPMTQIVLDEQVWSINGKTKVSRLVSCGEYHYTVSASGYPDVTGTVVVKKSIEPVTVDIHFK